MTFLYTGYMEDIVSHVGLCPETETHDTNALSCDTNTPPCDTNAPSCDDHVGCHIPAVPVPHMHMCGCGCVVHRIIPREMVVMVMVMVIKSS